MSLLSNVLVLVQWANKVENHHFNPLYFDTARKFDLIYILEKLKPMSCHMVGMLMV